MNRFLILTGCLAALLLSSADGRPPKIILDHADTLRSQGDVRHLIGNVRIRQGTTKIQAERAYHNSRTGLVDFMGSVVLEEPGRKITAAQMSYYEPTGNFEAFGNVDFLQSDSVRIRAQTARYYEDLNRLDLFDQVIINNLSDGASIMGRRARWERGQDLAVVEGDPVYRLPDREADPPDTLVIKSQQVTYYKKTRAALFAGDVDLTRRDLISVSDTLFYQPDCNRTILNGAPVIWHDRDELSGRYIE
ncbi:MAG: LptA/OstA family protein, partial [Calditrichota bacterium]